MERLRKISGKPAVLAGLRDQVRILERGGYGGSHPGTAGFALLDPSEAGGEPLPRIDHGALHEVRAREQRDRPAAFGFLLAVLARSGAFAPGETRPVLWCEDAASTLDFGCLHGPGLCGYGLAPDRFIVVSTRRNDELLWAMEEGVRSGALAAVVGLFGPSHGRSTSGSERELTASRRLQLAAERSGTTVFLLRQPTDSLASVARSRWLVSALPSEEEVDHSLIGLPRWQVTLDKCRGGRPGSWNLEWNYAAHCFHLVSPLVDRPVLPQRESGGEPGGDTLVAFSGKRGRTGRTAA